MDIGALRSALEAEANVDAAAEMAAYMRDHFPFLGVRSPQVRLAAKPAIAAGASADGDALIAFADECWDQPEREFQYVGALVLRRWVRHLDARHLLDLHRFVTTGSWWDTVDSLAAWSVGPLVRSHPELVAEMDRWVLDDDIWVARTAILHQLSYKDATDGERLFHYVDLRAAETEFFIRKALGWALRQYARFAPDEVRVYVESHRDQLSGLTVREALKHL